MTENPTNSANSISSAFKDVESLYGDLDKIIAVHILKLKNLSIDVNKGKCLDFGCGVGRLTNALALYFE